jgi:glycosyltransferase involved in cell wall biosynthesis
MRVLQVIRPAQGGMRAHLLRLMRHFRERGDEMIVAAPEEEEAAWREFLGPGAFRAVPISDRPHPAQDLRAARALAAILQETRPELLHAHGYRAAWVSAFAALLDSSLAPPILATAHNLLPAHPSLPGALAMRLTARRVSRWIAITEAVEKTLEGAGVPASRIATIPNGIDADALKPAPRSEVRGELGIPPDAPTAIVIGRLEPNKGVGDALRAFAMLRRAHPAARLLIAGEGPDRGGLEDAARSLGLGDSARFLGWRDDAASLLAASDVCLIPSRAEGQSLVALEAMALGVPVVASAVGGLPEMIRHEATGLLVPPRDPPALALSADRLLKDDGLRASVTRAASREARERWSESEMLRRTEATYRSLACAGGVTGSK